MGSPVSSLILTDCGEAWTISYMLGEYEEPNFHHSFDITQKGVRLLTWSTRIFFLRDWLELYHLKVFFCIE